MRTHSKNEFSKWLEESERDIKPEFNKRLIKGVIVPENLDSELLQYYISYRINKSNQELVKVTWVLAVITALIGILNLMIYFAK